jgi:hypothetical protein
MKQITADVEATRPGDINAKKHFFDAFGNRESEISAGWIVEFCQGRPGDKGSWTPFKLAELEAFYARRHNDGFTFNRLVSDGYVVRNGTMCVLTREFVEKCHQAQPAR